ncbi:Qat anti-phage system TatD family nuclease QatD [Oribacterium sp. NK2B42]|uniref:Qat anti-phage system TatD family nuclease QatD n=1 Tax=Oribacterium sp. NK2B42 TaxID=689781 RepID=UPI0003F5DC01|nr:Qat anti-phage system TatD family nuclease QatD [Oribacterium sp. NK2B42]
MLIDTHFHLDLMENMQALIREFSNSDVCAIAVGTTPIAYERERQFCFGVDNIRVGLGFHPQLVAKRGQEIDLFLKLIKNSRYIGEIGLDFNSSYIASKEQQLFSFRKIGKACAAEGNKVLSIHSVKAAGAVIDELEKAGTFENNICIFHWFTGTAAERRRAIEAGAWFSINPRMLKTKSGQETIKAIPADRLLLETDAPFVMKIRTTEELAKELNKLVVGISELRAESMFGWITDNSKRLFCD